MKSKEIAANDGWKEWSLVRESFRFKTGIDYPGCHQIMPFMYNHGLHDLDSDNVPLNLTLRDDHATSLLRKKRRKIQ
ncbi:hypothetical protein NC652_013211 [Populus alba x Populus x berolinensis]|nr:hypothetical protein NC652_013211 [Populus alba x Populus x berolinensis]